MFKIATKPTFSATVHVNFPADKGKVNTRAFTAIFKRFSQTQLEDLDERLKSKELDDRAFVHEVMVGWEGVADEQGTVLDFNEENLDALLEMHPTQPTIIRTFYATVGGGKVKN